MEGYVLYEPCAHRMISKFKRCLGTYWFKMDRTRRTNRTAQRLIRPQEILFWCDLPQILRGASSSSRMGCWRKISRDLRQSPRTSDSVICTVFPGREPRTVIQRKSNCVRVTLHSIKVYAGKGSMYVHTLEITVDVLKFC